MGQQESSSIMDRGIAPFRCRLKHKWYTFDIKNKEIPKLVSSGSRGRLTSSLTKVPKDSTLHSNVCLDNLRALDEEEAQQYLGMVFSELAREVGQDFEWEYESTIERWYSTLRVSEGLTWETFENNLYSLIRGSGIEDIPTSAPTIVAFVNPGSGGGQGFNVMKEMRNFLPSDQIVDMRKGNLDVILMNWIQYPNLKIIVAGGDGTVCWVLSILDKLTVEFWPAIAILPLGTGNDTARVMGWGGGYGGEPLSDILRSVCNSEVFDFDRWNIMINKLPQDQVSSWEDQIIQEQGGSDNSEEEGGELQKSSSKKKKASTIQPGDALASSSESEKAKKKKTSTIQPEDTTVTSESDKVNKKASTIQLGDTAVTSESDKVPSRPQSPPSRPQITSPRRVTSFDSLEVTAGTTPAKIRPQTPKKNKSLPSMPQSPPRPERPLLSSSSSSSLLAPETGIPQLVSLPSSSQKNKSLPPMPRSPPRPERPLFSSSSSSSLLAPSVPVEIGTSQPASIPSLPPRPTETSTSPLQFTPRQIEEVGTPPLQFTPRHIEEVCTPPLQFTPRRMKFGTPPSESSEADSTSTFVQEVSSQAASPPPLLSSTSSSSSFSLPVSIPSLPSLPTEVGTPPEASRLSSQASSPPPSRPLGNSPMSSNIYLPVSSPVSPPVSPPVPSRPSGPLPDVDTASPSPESLLQSQPESLGFVANNYFSIGFDSELLYQFEQLRQESPNLFVSRHTNYLVYGMLGLKHMMSAPNFNQKSLRHFCKLFVNGVEVPIPTGLQCLVVMNIPSYCGGINPWASSSNMNVFQDNPQSISDGLVEVFGLKGAAHLGLTKANLKKGGIRVAQGSHVQIIVVQPIACQVDGEAHMIGPSEITMKLHSRVPMLFNTEKGHRRSLLGSQNKVTPDKATPNNKDRETMTTSRVTANEGTTDK
eukprot:TRINITY_DN2356_c0_g1_i8.p1 TRINITY_DN2356_c0_g1~~TRINITY_DN2356_c0_g1_i8.p1  ORF type:complete len:935 (+),score=154.04 TRINITY_DN2356_c0_g1_i8:29-2806(+)